MKSSPSITTNGRAGILVLLALASMCTINLKADEWMGIPSQPGQLGNAPAPSGSQNGQQMFTSPDDAVHALRVAVQADDPAALKQIFGPQFKSLLTGDQVQDANNARNFAHAMAANCHLERESDSEFFVDVGTNDWPMPIPLMQANGQWYFDTVAGKEEIIDRHIGRDELTAIGVCRAYVNAQRQFASMNGGAYALRFKSSPGKRDGLYWPAAAGEPSSPFGALVAEAHVEGYGSDNSTGLHAFHGYYFRILKSQGQAAPGGEMDYLDGDSLKNGFALLAYPEHWNQSGVMTFLVGQDGKVYQHDFGEKTSRQAARIKEYNPDSEWSAVQDQGIPDAALGQ